MNHGSLLVGLGLIVAMLVAPVVTAPTYDERPPIRYYLDRLCTYTAPVGDTVQVRVNGVLMTCTRSGTRGEVTVYPTDLTLSPANITGGTFPASIQADDDDRLSLSESCWTYNPSNNSTYCDSSKWRFRWWFEWNGQVPQWTQATARLRVHQTGDAEPMRVLIREWNTGAWFTINIPPFPSEETLYEITITASQWTQYFGSIWTGLEDRLPADGTRTTVHVDEISVRLTTP